MDYATLLQLVQDMTENDETVFVSRIPEFVKMTEKLIYNSCDLPVGRKTSTSNFINGNAYLTLPSDFLAPFHIHVTVSTTATFLKFVDHSFIREAFPDSATTGTPKLYAMFDENTIVVGPTPNGNLATELNYYFYPTTIVTASTTWLGDNYDSALLYGSLVQAYTFMKGDDDLLKSYTALFNEAIAPIKRSAAQNSRDAYYNGRLVAG